jgi:hypothetical protein
VETKTAETTEHKNFLLDISEASALSFCMFASVYMLIIWHLF